MAQVRKISNFSRGNLQTLELQKGEPQNSDLQKLEPEKPEVQTQVLQKVELRLDGRAELPDDGRQAGGHDRVAEPRMLGRGLVPCVKGVAKLAKCGIRLRRQARLADAVELLLDGDVRIEFPAFDSTDPLTGLGAGGGRNFLSIQ